MLSMTTEFAEILNTVQSPGDFCTAGTVETFAPLLEIEGLGSVALPLLSQQAEQLVAIAEQAPYGRGEETLVNTNVRRTWQIGADRIRIQGRHWEQTLQSIVAHAAEGLGVTESVVPELYKLLVYDEGSFFVSHRDTEKAPGMFATLVIVLPSIYTGGELVVRHKGREERLELQCQDLSDMPFAAFYADCVHEILPITSGCRLTLIYNLIRQKQGPQLAPPDYETEKTQLDRLLTQWIAHKESPDDITPEKLIYPLEHAYTQAELSFTTLKGADAAAASVLTSAAKTAGCDLHLALISIEESGAAEYTGYDYEDDDELEAGEVIDRSAVLSDWRQPDGHPTELGVFPFDEEEISPPDALEGMEPDEQHFQEATGNAGASFERTYRRAAFVLWPKTRRLAVLNQAGLPVTLPYLQELAARWIKSGEDFTSSLWQEAHELSSHMLQTWSGGSGSHYFRHTKEPSHSTRMLTALTLLKDVVRIESFLADRTATGIYGKDDNEAVLMAFNLLPVQRAAELIERIITFNAASNLSACGDLLARSTLVQKDCANLAMAATALVKALPGNPAYAENTDFPRRSQTMTSDFVVDVLSALEKINGIQAKNVAETVVAQPKIYNPDAILIPAVLRLNEKTSGNMNTEAIQHVRNACLTHLRTRIGESLEPPHNWIRASTISCTCSDCAELSRFLANPDQKAWIFKAAEALRSHVESSIRQSHCDLDCSTDRAGRPYKLVCTKNQKSYDKRVQQRKEDLENLAQLEY